MGVGCVGVVCVWGWVGGCVCVGGGVRVGCVCGVFFLLFFLINKTEILVRKYRPRWFSWPKLSKYKKLIKTAREKNP